VNFACRRFPTVDQAKMGYLRAAERIIARGEDPRAAEPNVSVALGAYPDSVAGYVVVYGPEKLETDLEATWVGGDEVDPGQLDPEYLEGLAARRENLSLPGAIVGTVQRRLGRMRRDGTVDDF
jgi:hypothetical protein